MRTALILLFLLALASIPSALLPQWYLNESKTAEYIATHPTLGPLLDSLGFFDVIASPWYTAIYLLLAVSLVGCILPRGTELLRHWRTGPGRAPRNMTRLPHHAAVTVDGDAQQVSDAIRAKLRRYRLGGWRTTVTAEQPGTVTISAERGYLREVGNLTFHIAILGLLFTMAIGSLFGYTGSILVTEGEGFCSSAPVAYDNFAPGRMVDGTGMTPFCVDVQRFEDGYDEMGRPHYYRTLIDVQTGDAAGTDDFYSHMLNINDPLRIAGQRLYLLGHGYVPQFTVRYPNGDVRDYAAPFEPLDSMFTSEGVVKVTDPPGYSSDEIRQQQLAIVGVFAPSGVMSRGVLVSGYPEQLAPMVAVEVYRGDLGLEHGAPQSVFAIDTKQVDSGALVPQQQALLNVGETVTLDDGTEITFTGAKDFVALQTSYDPVQGFALIFAVLLVAGLLASLLIKRRRVWYRVVQEPDGATSAVQIGGLARTDQAGYGEEFDSLVALAGDRSDVDLSGGPGGSAVADGSPNDDEPDSIAASASDDGSGESTWSTAQRV